MRSRVKKQQGWVGVQGVAWGVEGEGAAVLSGAVRHPDRKQAEVVVAQSAGRTAELRVPGPGSTETRADI